MPSSSSSPSHPSLYLSFNDMFQNALIMQYWPIQLNFFLFTVCIFLSSLTLCNNFCISHMINPTELLHLFLAPHFRIFQVFVSCFWSFQVSASDVAILQIWTWICWWKDPTFALAILHSVSYVHLASFAVMVSSSSDTSQSPVFRLVDVNDVRL